MSFMKFCGVTSDALLDFLFPLSARASRVRTLTADMLKASPQAHTMLGISITTLARYHEKAIEDSIRALKYEKSAPAARLLATLLTDYLLDVLADASAFSDQKLVLVPMPLSRERERSRGYNQILLVLDQLPLKDYQAKVMPELLRRVRDTPPQTKLSRAERLKNMKEAFASDQQADYSKMHIFLIDDVTTTGATLKEAGKVLEQAGAKISYVAFAHA